MANTIQGELLPPETIQCDCCETTLRFGAEECSKCHSRVLYFMKRPIDVLSECAVFFASPFFVALAAPFDIWQDNWKPATIAICLSIGGMFAHWHFKRNWARRHEFKYAQFHRKTLNGYSTKSVSQERADAMYPYLVLTAGLYLGACLAVSFAIAYGTQSVLAMLGAPFKIDILAWVIYSNQPIGMIGFIYAHKHGWLDRLKELEKKFFA